MQDDLHILDGLSLSRQDHLFVPVEMGCLLRAIARLAQHYVNTVTMLLSLARWFVYGEQTIDDSLNIMSTVHSKIRSYW